MSEPAELWNNAATESSTPVVKLPLSSDVYSIVEFRKILQCLNWSCHRVDDMHLAVFNTPGHYGGLSHNPPTGDDADLVSIFGVEEGIFSAAWNGDADGGYAFSRPYLEYVFTVDIVRALVKHFDPCYKLPKIEFAIGRRRQAAYEKTAWVECLIGVMDDLPSWLVLD